MKLTFKVGATDLSNDNITAMAGVIIKDINTGKGLEVVGHSFAFTKNGSNYTGAELSSIAFLMFEGLKSNIALMKNVHKHPERFDPINEQLDAVLNNLRTAIAGADVKDRAYTVISMNKLPQRRE